MNASLSWQSEICWKRNEEQRKRTNTESPSLRPCTLSTIAPHHRQTLGGRLWVAEYGKLDGLLWERCPKCAEKNDRDSVRIERFDIVIQESVCSFVFEGETINHTPFSIVHTSDTPHCRPFAPWPHLHTSSRVVLLAGPQCNGCSVLPFTVHQIKCPMHLHNKGTPISSHDGHLLVHTGDLFSGPSSKI